MKRLFFLILTAFALTLCAAAYEIESAEISADAVTVRVSADADCALFVALYDADGRLISVQARDVSASDSVVTVTITGGIPEGATAKTFLTGADRKPLCKSKIATDNGGDNPDPTPTDDNGVYAILYSDGTLVFQHGNTPESGRDVRDTYAVDVTKDYYNSYSRLPWYEARAFISYVDFADTIQPTFTAGWFHGCTKLREIGNINNLDTANVTDMGEMFYGCSALASLDVTSFNTANVTNMDSMFRGCGALASLDVSNFNTANVKYMSFMFSGCRALSSLDLSSFNTANVTTMRSMFYGCGALSSLDLSSFNTANVTNMEAMFYDCSTLASLDVTSFNTANVTNMDRMFSFCGALSSLNLSSFNTANVTNMDRMFTDCTALSSLDLSSFNTANVTTMSSMFYGCGALSSLDLSSFNTANVTDMEYMFAGCTALSSLDLTSFNTANVTNMDVMFSSCGALSSLDVSNFNTENVTNMDGMFAGCTGLTAIYASEQFVTSQVRLNGDMFWCCYFLVGGAGTTYDSEHDGIEYAHIDGGPENPGYFTAKT